MRTPAFSTLAAALYLGAVGTAWGFGGQIAVGMNAANEVEAIDVPFTADATLETGGHTIESKIYFSDGRLRDEIDIRGQQIVYIGRTDLEKVWMLMPAGNRTMYMEMPYGESNEQVQEFRLVEREVVGEETVNGMATTKHRVVYEANGGRYGGFTWFNEHNIAVRAFMVTETDGEQQRISFEMSNLEVGPVDAAAFELPDGAHKLDMAGLVGGPGGAGQGGALPGFGSGDSGAEAGEAVAPGVAEELFEAAQQGARDAATEETERGVKDAVERGLRGVFGRD